jgi:hypothetical protein
MDAQGTVIGGGIVVVSILATLLFVLLFLFIAIVVPKLVFHFIQGPLEQRIAAHYGPEDILLQDLRANSFRSSVDRPLSTARQRRFGLDTYVITLLLVCAPFRCSHTPRSNH